jgi:hypothetical protein
MSTEVYGVAFSGSETDPQIYRVFGSLMSDEKGAYLRIWGWSKCDDRLDLYQSIINAQTNSVWGLDFPFAIPQLAYQALKLDKWQDLRELAKHLSREAFLEKLDEKLTRHEQPCTTPGLHCRVTDVEAHAQSPLKRVNPNMRSMLYAGLKLLHYLHMYRLEMQDRSPIRIFPFDPPYGKCIFEVYPSHTWAKVGMPRTTNLREFVTRFNALNLLEIILPPEMDTVINQDVADACIACITLATVISQGDLYDDEQPGFATDAEWAVRDHEGLIVRIED